MNSVMQTLFSIEEFKQRYVNSMEQIFNSPGYNDPAQDFNVQMAKLGSGLLSGYYSLQPKEETEALVSYVLPEIIPIVFIWLI